MVCVFVCAGRPLDENVCLRRSALLACRWEKGTVVGQPVVASLGRAAYAVDFLQTVWCVASHGHVDSGHSHHYHDLVFFLVSGGISPSSSEAAH